MKFDRRKTRFHFAATLFILSMTMNMTAFSEENSDEVGMPLFEDSSEVIYSTEGELLDDVLEREQLEWEEEQQRQRELAEAEKRIWLPKADPLQIEEYLNDLTQWETPIGSDGEIYCSRYLTETLERYGYSTSEQSFHEGFLNEDMVDLPGINLIVERGADSEDRKEDILLICTHYDSKTDPQEGDPLANDKSGAAVLMETARLLSGIESDIDVCFAFFSGEEDGGYGAQHFAKRFADEFGYRVASVLYVQKIGYETDGGILAEDTAENPPYLLKTPDGMVSEIGENIRLIELMQRQNEMMDLSSEGLFEEEEMFYETAVNGWEFGKITDPGPKSLADIGWDVTELSQEIGENDRFDGTDVIDESEQIILSTEKLASITDVLVRSIVSEMTNVRVIVAE